MPPVAAAVGAVAGFLGSTAFTIAGIGVSWGTVLMTTTSLASGLIASGRKPNGAVADPGRNIGIGVDAFMPRKCVYGRAAVSGDRVFADTYSSNQKLGQVLALSIGLISGVDTVMMNETEIARSGSSVTTAPWNGVMSLEFKNGTDAKTAYSGLAAGSSYWTTNHRGRGISDVFWELTYDQEKYSGGIPVPIFIGDYALVYDPRKDSSIGGDGTHRHDDPTTWEFSNSGPLQALHYLIGIYQNGKRVWGLGVPVDLIDIDSFAAAADVCEYEIEGKPRFKTGGRISDDDDPRQVLDSFAASFGGAIYPSGGLIRCRAGAPVTATLTLTDDDLDGGIEYVGNQAWRDAVNTVRVSFTDPNRDWRQNTTSDITDEEYVEQDGYEVLDDEYPVPLCNDGDCAHRLGRLYLANKREPRTIRARWKVKAFRLREGLTVNVNSVRLGVNEKMMVLERSLRPDGTVDLTLRTETDAKYGAMDDFSQDMPSFARVDRYDPTQVDTPVSEDWSATAAYAANDDQTSKIPVIRVAGGTTDPLIRSVLIEYRKASDEDWTRWQESGNPSSVLMDISGVAPGTPYDVAVRYRNVNGVLGDPLELSPVTTGALVATSAAAIGDIPADRVQAAIDEADTLAETQIREALDRRDRIRDSIAEVWSTFGTAEGFLVEVEEWTNQSELFSIAAAESATDAGNYSTAAAGYRAQALTYANNAGDSASAAAVSATAAAASETAAGNSATAAGGFAGAAETAATAAGDSASSASASATAAAASETAAGNSATAAGGFAGDAQTYATAAGDSASSAAVSATAAAASETAAGNSATAAGGFAGDAETAATAAGDSAAAASVSAGASAAASDAAGDSSSAAAGFAANAAASATSAGEEAAATLALRTEAQAAASSASSSATQATTASNNAAASATAASNSATASGNSASAASSSAAAADEHRAAAAQNAIIAAQFGASAKTDVADAADFFTSDLAGLDYESAAFTGWTETTISGEPVVYSTTSTISFGSRARFNPKPGRRYRVTALWRWTTGTVGSVTVGFRADPLVSGSAVNRWSTVTAGAANEWREASYEITADAAMAQESWRPVIRRTGNTGRIEVRALIWEDLSAFRAVGQDTVSVYSTAEESFAARLIQVSAGEAFAAIQLAARKADGTATSVLRMAAQLFGYGADFDNPRFFIDAVNNAVYGVADDGTTRTFELDFNDDGRLRIWKADGTLQFDSAGGGVYTAGIIENAATRMAFANQLVEFDMWGPGYGPGSSSNPPTRVFDQSVEFTDAEPGRPVSVFANFTHLINGGAFDWCNVCWELYRYGRSVSAPAAGAGTSGKVKLLSSTEEMQGATAGRVLQPGTVTSGGAAFPENHSDVIGDQLPGTGDGDYDATGYVYLMRVRVKATALLSGTNPYENANSHSGTRTHKVTGANLLAIQLKR